MLFIIAILFADSLSSSSKDDVKNNTNKKIERIISLSPSITETLFAIGLGDKVVGRTRYCNYPLEAKIIKEVGGYVDPNYEAIVALRADLVILLPEHENVKKYLTELNIKYLEVNNKTVANIINTIKIIGSNCDAVNNANKLVSNIERTIDLIKNKTKNLHRPATIISIGRTMGSGTLKDAYVAGRTTYFSELIELAGGVNAFENPNLAYPKLSAEGLIHLNPEVIVDLVTDLKKSNLDEAMVLKEWNSLGNIRAVKNKQISILSSDYIVIPGPRFVLLLKDLTKVIHPEIDWTKIDE